MGAYMPKVIRERSALRDRSGGVKFGCALTSFLYELMRNTVTPGVVEKTVQSTSSGETTYSNGWLAQYANDVAKRLLTAPVPDDEPLVEDDDAHAEAMCFTESEWRRLKEGLGYLFKEFPRIATSLVLLKTPADPAECVGDARSLTLSVLDRSGCAVNFIDLLNGLRPANSQPLAVSVSPSGTVSFAD